MAGGPHTQDRAIEQERLEIERHRPFIEAQTQLALSGIKNLILINGGAAIALLAFLGHAKEGGSDGPRLLVWAMLVFGVGVFSGGVCALLAYLFQTANRERPLATRLSNTLRWLAVLAAIGGLICFLAGLIISACAFSRQ